MLRRCFSFLAIVSFLALVCILTFSARQKHPFVFRDIPAWKEASRYLDFDHLGTSVAEQRIEWERRRSIFDRGIVCKLGRQWPEVTFDGSRLDETLDFINKEITGSRLVVKWDAIERAGIQRSTPVFLKFRNQRYSTSLARVVEPQGLGFIIDGHNLLISTRDDLAHLPDVYRQSWPWPTEDDLQMPASLSPFADMDEPDPFRQPVTYAPLSKVLASISRACEIPVDPKWEELRRAALSPESNCAVDGDSSQAVIENILRDASPDHVIQYQMRNGRLIIASREWFDRDQLASHRSALAAAIAVIAIWLIGLAGFRKWRRTRSVYVFLTIVMLGGLVAAAVWKAQSTSLACRAFHRQFSLDVTSPKEIALNINPTSLPGGPIRDNTPTAQSLVLYSNWQMTIERTGLFATGLKATLPLGLLTNLLFILPAVWLILTLHQSARRSRRRAARRCLHCGYDMRCSGVTCPECGTNSDGSQMQSRNRGRLRRRLSGPMACQ